MRTVGARLKFPLLFLLLLEYGAPHVVHGEGVVAEDSCCPLEPCAPTPSAVIGGVAEGKR